MPLTRSHIRATTEAYLTRHPQETDALAGLFTLLDGPAEPTSRTTLPGHITCSAAVVDRNRRVLHIGHKASGKLLAPGGHVEDDRTLLAAALREVCEETGLRPGDLCLTPRFLGAPVDIDVHDIDAGPDDAHGFWVAAAYLAPGLVRDFQAGTMTIVAPEEDSWAVAGPGDGTVRVHGPRDVWAELEDLHDRWDRAGRPDTYRVELPDGDGPQHVTAGTGPKALTWTLPPYRPLPRRSSSLAGRGSLGSLRKGTS